MAASVPSGIIPGEKEEKNHRNRGGSFFINQK